MQRLMENPDYKEQVAMADEFLVGPVSACNQWHKGVIQDNPPEANGYWVSAWIYGMGVLVLQMFIVVEENLGSSSDIHATTVMNREWETNPNAS